MSNSGASRRAANLPKISSLSSRTAIVTARSWWLSIGPSVGRVHLDLAFGVARLNRHRIAPGRATSRCVGLDPAVSSEGLSDSGLIWSRHSEFAEWISAGGPGGRDRGDEGRGHGEGDHEGEEVGVGWDWVARGG